MSEATKKNDTTKKPKSSLSQKKKSKTAQPAAEEISLNTPPAPSPSRTRHIEESKKKQEVQKQYNESKEQLSHVLSTLNVVIRKHQICTGTLTGVYLSPEGNVLGISYFENCTVYIPFDEMYIEYPIITDEHEDPRTTMIRERQMLQSMVGAPIEFVIKSMHFSDYENDPYPALSASRREAMMYLQRRYFGGDNSQKKPLVKVGDICDARIVNVSSNAIRVSLYGVDYSIQKRYLSYDYLGNLDRDENYCVGETLPVYIVKIEQKGNGLYNVYMNAKIPKHQEFASRLLNMPIGITVMARISKITVSNPQFGAPCISLWVPEPGVPAYAYSISKGAVKTALHPGDMVLLNILAVGEKEPYAATGVIIKKIKSYEAK